MKRLIAPLFLVLTLFVSAQNQYYHPDDWKPEPGLSGGPECVQIDGKTYAAAEDGKKGQLLNENTVKLSRGLVVEQSSINHMMGFGYTQKYEYNNEDESDVNVYVRQHFDLDDNLIEECKFTYDENGAVETISVEEYQPENPGEVDYAFTIVFENNDKGLRAKQTTKKPDGSVRVYVNYGYDAENNMIARIRSDANNEWMWTDSLFYDDNNNLIRERTIRPGLDGKNKITELEFGYNKNGLRSSITVSGSIQEVTYDYDQHGNWITRTMFLENDGVKSPYTITERSIQYIE